MLVSFSVSNFRSFGEEVTLNMVASNKLAEHPGHRIPIGSTGKDVLRSGVIYGANAAGKSNLIQAIEIAQRLITKRTDRIAAVEPFRFRASRQREPSSFEFRFLVGDRVFIYGFDILLNKFVAEWLSVHKGDDEIVIFERDADGKTSSNHAAKKLFPEDEMMFKSLKVMERLPLKSNQLFLNRAGSVPGDALGATLQSIIRWFNDELLVLRPEHRSCEILERLYTDEDFREFCSTFLRSADTGIGRLEVREIEREATEHERDYLIAMGEINMFGACDGAMDLRPKPDDPTRVLVRRLIAEHMAESGKYALPFSEESDGTVQLLHLMPVLSSPPEQSRVVIIDELDRSLHPLICWEFIRFFSESCPNARKQLIVTTHEAHLLNQDLLRRDEYWFVEKDASQQTRLVALSDFNIRKDLQVQKGYLHGRFGAIPMIGGMGELEKMLECPPSETRNATQETST